MGCPPPLCPPPPCPPPPPPPPQHTHTHTHTHIATRSALLCQRRPSPPGSRSHQVYIQTSAATSQVVRCKTCSEFKLIRLEVGIQSVALRRRRCRARYSYA